MRKVRGVKALNNLTNPTFGEAALIALMGILFVFAVLAFLMVILMISAAIFGAIERKKKAKAASKAPAPAASPVAEEKKAPLAKGSCGDLKLHDVPARDAAMVMAIVADELKTPLNELRFTSIKKAESEEAK